MSVVYTGRREAAKRLSWFILFVIGVLLMVMLYFVKTQSQSARKEVERLKSAAAQERAAIKVLEAELAVLKNPARLSDLAQTHLQLTPVLPEQTRTIDGLVQAFPLRLENSGLGVKDQDISGQNLSGQDLSGQMDGRP